MLSTGEITIQSIFANTDTPNNGCHTSYIPEVFTCKSIVKEIIYVALVRLSPIANVSLLMHVLLVCKADGAYLSNVIRGSME